MATAKESHTCQQFTARNSPYLDHMALPHLDKNISLPCFPPYKCTANAAYPGQYDSDLPSLYTGQQDSVGGFSKPLPPYCNVSYPTGNLYLRDSQCALSRGLGVVDKPVGTSFAPQRRFLIFDRSENHTRLFFSPSFSPQDQIVASKTPTSAIGLFGKVATQVDRMKPIVEEKWDENHLSDGEGEMLEDTEEINALLYSDSDDDDGENDEVSSTGHSAFSLQEGYDRDKSFDEVREEVASCDESPKRQRLLDGKYKKPSLESAVRAMNRADSCSYEDDVESRCAGDDGGIGSNKVKIRQALKMLESIIPGLDNKDPLSIIDGAVAYLKSMKTEAETLGLSSATPPQPLL